MHAVSVMMNVMWNEKKDPKIDQFDQIFARTGS